MNNLEDRREARKAFEDLLLLGGAAAANAHSLTHRGSYATSAERWGLEYWANYLSERETAMAGTIISAIVALSFSEGDQQRKATAAALRTLVQAARVAPSRPPRQPSTEPRRYWIDER